MHEEDEGDFHNNQVQSPFCPTCGQKTVMRANPEWLLTHFTNKNYATILATLISRRRDRKGTSITDLCREVYRDDPKGAPLYGSDVIFQSIANNRPKLMELGWLIASPALTRNGYQIVPLDSAYDMME